MLKTLKERFPAIRTPFYYSDNKLFKNPEKSENFTALHMHDTHSGQKQEMRFLYQL